MIVTLPFIRQKFAEFNNLIFGGKLPEPEFKLTRARTFYGKCVFRRTFGGLNRGAEACAYTIRISLSFDLPKCAWEDVLIHEMIHYYIGISGQRDTSSHGPLFRRWMDDINSRFGRHITISRRMSQEEHEANGDVRQRVHVVAAVLFRDGRVGFKVVPRKPASIRAYCHGMMALSGENSVAEVRVFVSIDPFFNQYPVSAALHVYFPKDEQSFFKIIEDAARVM